MVGIHLIQGEVLDFCCHDTIPVIPRSWVTGNTVALQNSKSGSLALLPDDEF